MNNRINLYRNNLVQPFGQPAQRSEGPVREAGRVQESGAPAAARPRPVAVVQEGLSLVEQQMIERYFPKSEAMTLRLYGANRSAQTINPGAVGGQLDVRG